jgi:FtsP/CotA-like multicopper oxidase with cupredoxin domain
MSLGIVGPGNVDRRQRRATRRTLLAGGMGAGGSLLAASALRRSAGALQASSPAAHMDHGEIAALEATPSWLLWEPADLIEPEIRVSAGGELTTDLRVGYAWHDIGGYRLNMRAYEGGIPGPTLRVQPGDTLRIRLHNDLPPNSDPVPLAADLPHHFNTTNVHTHGLHVSPAGIADNVFRAMEPGESYDIEIAIPADHTRGTYWYHPHHHGSADMPEIAAARERVPIVSEALFDFQGAIESYDTVWPEAVPRFLAINGQREPIIRLRPGEVQRWRIVQAAHESNLRIALEGHALHSIAYDGIQSGYIDSSEDLVIAPGQRVDVLVKAGEAGEYLLHAIDNDQGYPSPVGPLARVVVEGEPLPMELPAALPTPPLAPIADDEITGGRELVLSALQPEFLPAANYQEFRFLIDGRLFDPKRVDQHISLGAVEEWTVINDHEDDHVFHIHTNPFQMTHVNGEPLAQPGWRDTVIVPREGSITFRARFLDFPGKTVLHCHKMNHEELGMMQVIEFVAEQ